MIVRTVRDALRRIVPLTPRGFLLFALSLGIFAVGGARVDLAGLFWGSSFLLVSLYAILASHLTSFLVRRRRNTVAKFLSVSLPAKGLFPGDQGQARVSVDIPRSIPPGFSVRFALPLSWHSRRVDSIEATLSPGGNSLAIPFEVRTRGSYRCEKAMLEIRDVLGFTSNAVEVQIEDSLTVWPAVHEGARFVRVVEEGGEAIKVARHRRRSEELLEARKYFPGDDVRKLNWKVFAHANELFLRIGEETPPPESHVLFVLDSTSNPLVPRRLQETYIDGMVASCASAMTAFLARRIDSALALPGERECRAYTEETRNDLLSILAGVWWTAAVWKPELPSRPRIHAIVISSPGSPSLGQIMEDLRNRGWSMSLLLKNVDPFEAPRRGRLLDLLFVPDHPGASRPLLPRRRPGDRGEEAVFASALADDLARYRGGLWRLRHVEEI